jgi:hypothetical protein
MFYGQGPSVSPWARCAGTARSETAIVTNGFVSDPVLWQIVTFNGYWYWRLLAPGEPPNAAAAITLADTATTTTPLNLPRRRLLNLRIPPPSDLGPGAPNLTGPATVLSVYVDADLGRNLRKVAS